MNRRTPPPRRRTIRTRAAALLSPLFALAFAAFALAACAAAPSSSSSAANAAAPLPSPPGARRITTASFVRVRSAPDAGASEVARLSIGTVVDELETSATPATIDGKQAYWYRVATAAGARGSGWVFGAYTAPYRVNARSDLYRKIAAERTQNESLAFAELADLAKFLARAASETAEDAPAAADLELALVRARKRAAAAIPVASKDQSPYREWVASEAGRVNYDEISGTHLLAADSIWKTEEKYRALAAGDEIAWEAATTQLGGECEGYFPCMVTNMLETDGRYLDRRAAGAHAAQAVANIEEYLSYVVAEPQSFAVPAEDRRALAADLAKLKAIVAKTKAPRTAAVLAQIAAVEKLGR